MNGIFSKKFHTSRLAVNSFNFTLRYVSLRKKANLSRIKLYSLFKRGGFAGLMRNVGYKPTHVDEIRS